ncbi:glycosyltransferase family 2 protein [Flavobacterium capsici]|uniref:Glycosyltransferase family 2 protein n=1 Tax=Flavobacterium capsici TaxID=3075618 RepID=A0AA96JBC1_9FLAO|nr:MULTISPECIES: glycosyltransferase family 2 protein [unclassified Flavobacterium]WNM18433.1 glycosyltransferase family 2 protein [Flavobacterium sp. PMR2A8]WNM22484.1 glycosyltransferase family 2 protein [Flavobacterium sp. PMTSA4]
MKKIAVVILNWNGAKLLEQFLPSVINFSDEATIYIADNASTDNSIQFIKDNYPTVSIIQNKDNFGFAKGYNIALEHIEEEIYCLLNSDVEVTQNWLTPILSAFENDSKIGIIQPKILDYKDKTKFEYAGAAGGFIDKYGYPFCRGRIFENIEEDSGQYDDEKEIFWASGACFFIRKEVYRKLNGFDDDFFAHQEEIDLCWRAFNLGYKAKYIPNSTVYHVGGATLNEGNPKKTFLNFRNSLFMLLKNLPENKLVPIIFTRLVLDGIAGIQFLLKGKFKHFVAILKAHFSFYSFINKMLKKRSANQSPNYFYNNSIVYSYFVKKLNRFVNI